jgi:hypothetical protein
VQVGFLLGLELVPSSFSLVAAVTVSSYSVRALVLLRPSGVVQPPAPQQEEAVKALQPVQVVPWQEVVGMEVAVGVGPRQRPWIEEMVAVPWIYWLALGPVEKLPI